MAETIVNANRMTESPAPNHSPPSREMRGRSKKLQVIIGGAMVGASMQGLIEAISNNKKALIITYVIVGFAGMVAVFSGIWRR